MSEQTNNPRYWYGMTGGAAGHFYSMNGYVACRPFTTLQIEVNNKNAFATAKQKTTVLATEVVFGNDKFSPGMKVYVPADVVTLEWAKRAYEAGGQSFIMVEVARILLVECQNPPR